jgi:peptidoglycan/LPS O-acetylase OafA/YrhL
MSTLTTGRSGLRSLARIEAGRFARHPLFGVGVLLLALATFGEIRFEPSNTALLADPIVAAAALGVFGLIVAARLTRSSARSLDAFGSPPVPERTRTAALALACLVPFGVGLLWVGVVIGRWVRWSGAPIVAAVLLVAVTVPTSGIIGGIRPYREFMPWTQWHGGDSPSGGNWLYEGNPRWWLLYTVCLCALATIAALLHDRDLPRRGWLTAAAVILAVAAVAYVLTITTGEQLLLDSPPTP